MKIITYTATKDTTLQYSGYRDARESKRRYVWLKESNWNKEEQITLVPPTDRNVGWDTPFPNA